MYIFSTEYIFLKPKDQTNEHEQKKNKQMNHKNKDVHIYSKYRLVFIFYVFNNIYTHHKHLKKKTEKSHKMIKKTHSF